VDRKALALFCLTEDYHFSASGPQGRRAFFMPKQTQEIAIETQNEEELFILDDIQVETLGLVERGAVDENFFLLKSEDDMADMADMTGETQIMEAAATDENDLTLKQLASERLKELIEKGRDAEEIEVGVVNKADSKKKKKPKSVHKNLSPRAARGVRSLLSSYGDELPPNIAEMLATLVEDTGNLTGGDDKEKTQKDSEVNNMENEEKVKTNNEESPPESAVTKAKASVPPETELLEAKTDAPPDVVATKSPDMTNLLARLEKAETAQDETLARLQKAETALAEATDIAEQEREARERIQYIEKAREFDALGTNPDDLGGFLHRLAQSDEMSNLEKSADAEDRVDSLGYISAILKAANEQVIESGFYEEAGSSRVPQNGSMTLLQKAQAKVDAGEYPDITAALMKATPEEAAAHRTDVLGGVQ